jgi:cytidine deaminase
MSTSKSGLQRLDNTSELAEDIKELVLSSRKALSYAYPPNPDHSISAAALLEDGFIVSGHEPDYAHVPSQCAEKLAVLTTSSLHPGKPIKAIALHCDTQDEKVLFITPCPSCRQVLYDYEKKQDSNIRVFLLRKDFQHIWMAESAAALLQLPFVFNRN